MKVWLSSVLILMGTLGVEAHPLHLSVTNITIENGILKVRMKTFLDDWEVAFFHETGETINLLLEENRDLPWFTDYLNRSFRLGTGEGKKELKLTVSSVSIEKDAMQIEMQSELGRELKSLYIYQALLTDIYPDQNNLVILSFGKRETGIKFDVRKLDELVSLD